MRHPKHSHVELLQVVYCSAPRQKKLVTHGVVISPILGMRNTVGGRGTSVLKDVSTITDVREDMLDTVGAILGLPSTCMKSFGHINCLLSSNVVNVEPRDSSFQVDTEGARTSLIVPQVHLGSLPFLFHFFVVHSFVSPFHERILSMLGKKEMLPNLLTGEPSGSQHLEFLVKLQPVNVDTVPEVFRLHLAAFSLKGISAKWDQQGMPGGQSRPKLAS